MKDEEPKASAPPPRQAAKPESAKEPELTLDDIKSVVASIVRDELSNWQPPEALAAPEKADEGPGSVDEIFFALSELQKYNANSRH